MLPAILALAPRGDPASHRGHPLTDVQVQPCHKYDVALAAQRGQHRLDRRQRAEDDPVCHADHTPTPVLLYHLRIQQPRPRHPAWLGRGPKGPRALRLVPHAAMAQDGRQLALEAVAEPQGHTA